MHLSRRSALKSAALTGLGLAANLALPPLVRAAAARRVVSQGNPIIPNLGACDPQVRVYDGHVYLYSTHDASPDSTDFVMHDWRVWHTTDLVQWELVSTLRPEQTYFRKPSSQCWATDAARRNGNYYLYFSMGPEDIGVVQGPTPAGPWHDPLGHALIPKGMLPTEARDPGILQEEDGTTYIVFGTMSYYIARLNSDMVSLAETPRLIQVNHPEGPYGKGTTDDKPFLHRRGGKYYLSWGCYYAIGDSPYGPFDCKGSLIHADRLSPEFLDPTNRTGPHAPAPEGRPQDWLGYDRHGSFFELHGQWYYICNDQALPGSSTYFRNSVLSYIRYRDNGEIDPVRISTIGVAQYNAAQPIPATDFFAISGGRVAERPDVPGTFQVRDLVSGSTLTYPRIRNLAQRRQLTLTGTVLAPVKVEIRRGNAAGVSLGSLSLTPGPAGSPHTVTLARLRDTDNLCLVLHGGPGELIRLDSLSFS